MVTSLSLSILSRDRSIASSIVDTGKKDEIVPKEVPVPGGPATLPSNPSVNPSANPSEGTPATPPAAAPSPAK